jgi:hypothetical protein
MKENGTILRSAKVILSRPADPYDQGSPLVIFLLRDPPYSLRLSKIPVELSMAPRKSNLY